MCTVVFIPGKDGYSFASLRDENPMRQRALSPAIYSDDNIRYLSPLDPAGNGTWIGVNECGNVVILLNGGFSNHLKQQQYAKSRGMVVRQLLCDEMPVIAWSLLDLSNVEPFTLVVWMAEKLFQLVWDGQKKHRILLSNKIPHIFSSATLYDKIAKDNRTTLFEEWMESDPAITPVSLGRFFKTASADTQNGFIIHRAERIKTLSYSFIEIKNHDAAEFHYHDLSTNSAVVSTITLQVNEAACSFTLNN